MKNAVSYLHGNWEGISFSWTTMVWLEQIFPEYCPARFDRFLSKLGHSDGKDQIQIFIGLVENQVASLMQLFYKEWQEGLLADIDLLGVLEPFRRSGLALALVQRSLEAIGRPASPLWSIIGKSWEKLAWLAEFTKLKGGFSVGEYNEFD